MKDEMQEMYELLSKEEGVEAAEEIIDCMLHINEEQDERVISYIQYLFSKIKTLNQRYDEIINIFLKDYKTLYNVYDDFLLFERKQKNAFLLISILSSIVNIFLLFKLLGYL